MVRDNTPDNYSDTEPSHDEDAHDSLKLSDPTSDIAIVFPPRQKKLLDAGNAIWLDAPEELCFATDVLTQASLPIREPTTRVYTRRNGKFRMDIMPVPITNADGDLELVFPYGVYPRRALIWIITEALRTDSRRVELGSTLHEFMTKKLGLTGSGGQRMQAIRKQLLALLGAQIRVSSTSANKNGKLHDKVSTLVISNYHELWTDLGKPDHESNTTSFVELSEEFFSRLQRNRAVPLDMRAVDALGNDALALDIYAWVVWRVHAARGREFTIRWHTLKEQFGSEIKEVRNFRAKFLRALERKVGLVYNGLEFESTPTALTIKPSPLAIPPKRKTTKSRWS